MRLIDNAAQIGWRLWSVRFAIGAALLIGIDVFMQFYAALRPSLWISVLAAIFAIAAAFARLVPQPRAQWSAARRAERQRARELQKVLDGRHP